MTEVDVTLESTWLVGRPYLRHSTRHLHRTMFDYLSSQLELMKWTVDGETPFSVDPVVLQDVLPQEFEEESQLVPGTVAVTLGDEADALNQELGGPLAMIEVPFFVDVFMDTPGTTLALALDIRDALCGRTTGSSRYHNVINYNTAGEPSIAPGYTVEVEDVTRVSPKKNWETVKFTCLMYFQDSEGN